MRNIRAMLLLGFVLTRVSPALSAYTTFVDNGPSSNRIDMIFLGDGYTAGQLGAYRSHVGAMMSHVFDGHQEPFVRYRHYFNAHRIDVISPQSGADDPSVASSVDTRLDGSYRWDGITDRLLYVDEAKANAELAAGLEGALAADIKLISINSDNYGGGGGNYAVYAGGNAASPEIALHELGHSFAGLADEYGGDPSPYLGREPQEPNVTKDPSGARWERWLGYEQPRLGVIGAYEGARYYDTGLYRPSRESKMRSLGEPFDAVGREEIILDIYRMVDPLDAWLGNADPLVNPVQLWVDPIDPYVVRQQWFVDGLAVEGATAANFDPLAFGYGAGTYTITAHAFDATDWVRSHLDLLQEDVSWRVTYAFSVAEPGVLAQLAVILGGALAGHCARRSKARARSDLAPGPWRHRVDARNRGAAGVRSSHSRCWGPSCKPAA